MNLKLAFLAVLMALALLEATEAKKGKKSKNLLKKGEVWGKKLSIFFTY